MSKQKKESKQGSLMSRIALIQVAVMLILTMVMVHTVSSKTNENTKKYCETVAMEKSSYIESYIDNAENILREYACADEIINVISEPEKQEYLDAAQKYTEKVSETINNLEGIYVSKWSTEVLAHTNAKTRGLITRTDQDKLNELHNYLINSAGNLYDAGIIISPATGEQIISMYMAVFDDQGLPVGIVGLGIMTEDIVNDLDSSSSKLTDSSAYCMINTNNNKYIFSSDKAKIYTDVENESIKKIVDSLRGNTASSTGNFNYSENGKSYYSVYSYNADRGWVYMVDGPHSELFALTTSMIIFLLLFSAIYIAIAIVFNMLGKKQEETFNKLQTSIKKTAKTKESLNKAVFQDILTDCKNRIAFSNDFEAGKIKDATEHPYYFMMFNISDFSAVNIMYGEDIGDEVLASVSGTIRSVLEGAEVYRIGSDEFVAVMQGQTGPVGISRTASYADSVLSALIKPINTSAGPVMTMYRASIVKKSHDIDPSVLPALKDISNQNGPANPGQIPFLDMDSI